MSKFDDWYSIPEVDVKVGRGTIYWWKCPACKRKNELISDPTVLGSRYCENCGKEVSFKE